MIEYNTEQNELKFKYYLGVNIATEKIIQIDEIVGNKLETRIFDFGFDVLSIKYIDEQNLYNLIDLIIDKKEDWIGVLSSIKTKADISKSVNSALKAYFQRLLFKIFLFE